MKKSVIILGILMIILTELLLLLDLEVGFYAYLIVISVIFLFLSGESVLGKDVKIFLFLLILPIARISLFFVDFGYYWNVLIFYSIILFLSVYYIFELRINPGFIRKNLALFPLIIFLAIIIGFVSGIFVGFPSMVLIALLPLSVFAEEILFRGLIQNFLRKEFSPVYSIFFTALIAGIFAASQGVSFFIVFFLFSLFNGIVYNSTENLYLTIIFNLVFSVILFF